jgi:putative ABC transport system permease protein
MTLMLAWLPTVVTVVILVAIATVGLSASRVAHPWAVTGAIGRAVLQLAALSLVLTGILGNPWWVALGLVVMFVAAVFTAARRSRADRTHTLWLASSMVAGPLVAMAIVFATGAIEFSPRYALAVGGIVIGNTMTIAILTQRIFTTSVRDHWDEVEGWLALGARPQQSTLWLARASIRTALLPSIDQTRTTGIVVLPGAFVGAIFGGASPLEAGRFQIVVLACILAAGVLTSTVLTRLMGGITQQPAAVEPAKTAKTSLKGAAQVAAAPDTAAGDTSTPDAAATDSAAPDSATRDSAAQDSAARDSGTP